MDTAKKESDSQIQRTMVISSEREAGGAIQRQGARGTNGYVQSNLQRCTVKHREYSQKLQFYNYK